MFARDVPAIGIAVILCSCAAPPDSFEGAYASHASSYGDAMKAAVHAYEKGEIPLAEMRARLHAAARNLAVSDAATAQSEERELSSYSKPVPPPRPPEASHPALSPPASSGGDSCFLIPCPEPAQPPANGGP